MNHDVLTFEKSTLQLLMDRSEFDIFCEIISRTASEHAEVRGVLLTGSLIQRLRLPNSTDGISAVKTPWQSAYEEIVSRSRRKLFPHPDADLDVWLLIEDRESRMDVCQTLDDRALDLVKWYAKKKSADPAAWIRLKHRAFDEFYKQEAWFPRSWVASNPLPYYAWSFKETVIDRIGANLQACRGRIKNCFRKKYPTEFLELRAFPQAVFNVRPEKIALASGTLDRTPFAYYLKDWLDLEQNCLVVYTKPRAIDLIYPFNPAGRVLGQKIADQIKWDHRRIDYSLFRDRKDNPQLGEKRG